MRRRGIDSQYLRTMSIPLSNRWLAFHEPPALEGPTLISFGLPRRRAGAAQDQPVD